MKKVILAFVLLLNLTSFSQILEPVKWSTSVEKISETEYNLISTATIDSGWHLYSQDVPEDGPIPTTFTYDDEAGAFKIVGNTSEEKGHTIDDPVFEMKIKFFEKSARFVQKITVAGDKTKVNAFVEFMVCDDARCLPPTEVDLVFDLSKSSTVAVSTVTKEQNNSTISPSKKESKKGLWGIFF
ncbi:MAG: hypothetical protein KAH07_00980, partial [Flavobacteriaceae bacterium]|nr:hypothetical protein [Flavobacteriaceae bacterium]